MTLTERVLRGIGLPAASLLLLAACGLASTADAPDETAPQDDANAVPSAFAEPDAGTPAPSTLTADEPSMEPDATEPLAPAGDAALLLGPAQRSLGVVLIDHMIDDGLNLRQRPGAGSPILATLHRTQTKLIPTGNTQPVDGRPWHEIIAGDVVGWVHGRYVTETWDTAEVQQRWDWKTALDRFADALATGEDLVSTVSWCGFYAVDEGGRLHWWKPSEVPRLHAGNPSVNWEWDAVTFEEVGPTPFHTVITDSFLGAYYDPDVQFEVRGMPLGGGAVIASAAVSPAFENFVWVSVHDPGDNPEFEGLDWITWFVYLELDGTIPKVVGVQRQMWGL